MTAFAPPPVRAVRWTLAFAAALAVATPVTAAQAADDDADAAPSSAAAKAPLGATPLETITVVGTRTERMLRDVPATISVIDSEQIEEQVARDIADLVRFEPGVSVGGTGSRFGLGGFTIRGIGGNRVLTTIDGIRVPEEFSFGPFLSARRDFVDVDGLARAEIARGPISSLYGSDALGGVVALRSKEPTDYLDDGRPLFLGGKLGYSSPDDSVVGTFTGAAGNDLLSAMVLYTRREASETANQGEVGGTGPTRELPDPQDITTDNIVARLALTPGDAHRFTLGVDYLDSTTLTQVLSDYGTETRGVITERRDADDRRERTRVSLAWEYEGDLILADTVRATVYTQASETVQLTEEDRNAMGAREFRSRTSIFEQQISGGFLQLERSFSLAGSQHDVVYGVEVFRTDSETLREGLSLDAAGNPIPQSPFEPPLPTRDFPLTQVTQSAFFLQDEITLANGRLLLSPGLRYDRFDASAEADALYLSGNPGAPMPEDYADEELTLRFGALLDVNDYVSAYARYSEGFRAPPYDDVNVGFSNVAGGYKTLPNPNLASERSNGVEAGLRFNSALGAFTFAWYHNEYDNFIESFVTAPAFLETGGVDPSDGLFAFQSVNREQVVISGLEMTALVDLGTASDMLEGFTFRASIAYADGQDTARDVPLNTVDPLTGVFGLGYAPRNQRWGADVILTLVDSKDQDEIDQSTLRPGTDSYALVDLLGRVDITERITFNAGIFNLTDQTYIRWADTGAIGGDAPLRFTQPGINFGANLRVRY